MQGFNKYYPPDYVPESGSLNKLNGKHALGDRARKIDQGILITRFEIPYNIWCLGCNNHIGMGVRFNAEKSKVGMYFSTPIFNFRCKCHLCSNWFEIRTDPQNTRYVVHSGAKQKNEEWDPAENGGFVLEEKLSETSDPLEKLERSTKQKTKALSAAASLDALEQLQSDRWSDPYTASRNLRATFRKEKKVRVESEGRASVVRDKYGLGERVRIEDLRTPREAEDRSQEDRDWNEARMEREKREEIGRGKRKREIDQLGWKDESSNSSRGNQARTSSSSTSGGREKGRRVEKTSQHSNSRPTKPLPTRSKLLASPALLSLAKSLKLSSALKLDPFLPNSGSTSSSSGKIGKEKEKKEIGINFK